LASVEIYVGAPIEHGSDRRLLAEAMKLLSARAAPAILIANTHFSQRQIDLIVAVEGDVVVLEAKSFRSPVRGSENGDWQVRLASGGWKDIRNPHIQAIDARHAVRDAMARFAEEDAPYPSAALVFLPGLPAGSSVSATNFKAAIVDEEALASVIPSVAGQGWTLARWRAFAHAHNLTRVRSLDAALDPQLLEADQMLGRYGEAFSRTYRPIATELVSGVCHLGTAALSFDDLASRAVTEPNLSLIGPSGCGKSLLSYSLALGAMARGDVPIVLAAKDFYGNVRDVANREVSLLGASSAQEVLAAARRLGRSPLFVIDGYNECTPGERVRFTRSIVAAAQRYEARVILSSRSAAERADLLGLREYVVRQPERETKLAIARQASGGVEDHVLQPLLDTVSSGLEARIVGQLGKRSSAGTSRYGLFDLYVRERLGPDASDGIKALSRVAGMMFDRLSFSVSARELDRLFDKEGLKVSLLRALQAGNILAARGDRFTFSHEMFLNVFAAEAVVRQSDGDADVIREKLVSPRHADTKSLIVAAIDDDALRLRVLSGTTDTAIVQACLAGQCGRAAQRWANVRCDEVLARVAEEIKTLTFDIDPNDFMSVRVNPDTVCEWSREECAVLRAIPQELAAGRRLDDLLTLVAEMDARLLSEHRRLREQAAEKNVAVRSALFAACYVYEGLKPIGLAQICVPIHSGMLFGGQLVAPEADLKARLASENLTHGQIGLLLQLHRHARRDEPSIADILPGILERTWRFAPYHLRLDLMQCCGFAGWNASEADKKELIRAVEALQPVENVLLSTAVIDALKFLGALDEQESSHLEAVRREIAVALEDEQDADRCVLACGIWNAQYDHPFDGAYCEAWRELSADDRKRLLWMAARGTKDSAMSLFVTTLIVALASYDDPAVGPLISRFARLPPTRCSMPQDAIHNFAMAHIVLGRLGCLPPACPSEPVSPAAAAWLACGDILYWLNRADLTLPERKLKCSAPLRVLSDHDAGVAAAVLEDFELSDRMFAESLKQLQGTERAQVSIGAVFSDSAAEIFRAALRNPDKQAGYFDFFRLETLIEACLSALGRYGTADDIDVIRPWSHHPRIGQHAITAIKRLEA
jgi:hypothetical protein